MRTPSVRAESARNLVAERTRISNRLKSALARLGIRGFKPMLRKAPQRLAALRTPEGLPIPPNTLAEMQRDMARLAVVRAQIEEIEQTRLQALEQAPEGERMHGALAGAHRRLGIETADMLVQEVLSRNLRDRRAVARYAGLTGTPDESGSKRREKGLAKSGNSRVRRGLIQLAWRFLMIPEKQRTGAVVSGAHGRPQGRTQDHHDRRPRPETADRALAHGQNRRRAGGGGVAAARIGLIVRRGTSTVSATSRAFAPGR